jgi:hypothetical protein
MRIRQTAVDTEQRGAKVRSTKKIEKRIKNVNIVIDSERSKKVFSNILQAFEKSKAKEFASDRPNTSRMILRSPVTKLAAAAAMIITAVSLLIICKSPHDPIANSKVMKFTNSPAEMLTATSLIIAFRRGGIEAIEKQCDKALEMQKPPLDKLDIKELFTEIEIDLERMEL